MNVGTLTELKETLAQLEGHHAQALTDQVEELWENINWLIDAQSRMTAEQFAAHNGLKGIDLRKLGKIAQELAGDKAGYQTHVRYGMVGFHHVSVWQQAYKSYLWDTDSRLSVREYLHLVGYWDLTKGFIRLVESLAQVISWQEQLPVLLRGTAKRVSRRFTMQALESAVFEVAA